jgi:hypothetical protein
MNLADNKLHSRVTIPVYEISRIYLSVFTTVLMLLSYGHLQK